MLADIIADAQMSGVRFGSFSLARHLLRAGYRQVVELLPPLGLVRRGRRATYPRRVVVVVDEPGRRQVLQLTGLSGKLEAEYVANRVGEAMRELYPWREVRPRVLPADVAVDAVLDGIEPILGPPRPSAGTVRTWLGPDATIGGAEVSGVGVGVAGGHGQEPPLAGGDRVGDPDGLGGEVEPPADAGPVAGDDQACDADAAEYVGPQHGGSRAEINTR